MVVSALLSQDTAEIADAVCDADPVGRRDPMKVAAILRLEFEENWTIPVSPTTSSSVRRR